MGSWVLAVLSLLALAIPGYVWAACRANVVFDHLPQAVARFLRPLQHAQTGDPEAQFQAGLAYEAGSGTIRDDAEAFRWYQKAAHSVSWVGSIFVG